MPTIIASRDHNLDPAVFQKPRHSGRSRKLKLCPICLNPLSPPQLSRSQVQIIRVAKYKIGIFVSKTTLTAPPSELPTNSNQTKRQRAFAAQTNFNYYSIKQICVGEGFVRNLGVGFIADTLATFILVQYLW